MNKMQIREEDRTRIRETLLYLADSMILLNDISKMHTCNDCGISTKCAYCPRVGKPVRYNCPLWQQKENPKEG